MVPVPNLTHTRRTVRWAPQADRVLLEAAADPENEVIGFEVTR